METFEGENMETQNSFLTYRVNLYFHDYKSAIKVDEKEHKDRNKNYEKQIQKEIETELGCKFVRINHDEENFNISKVNNKIFRSIKKSLIKLSEELTLRFRKNSKDCQTIAHLISIIVSKK